MAQELPVEVLERLSLRAKRIADPEVNLEQLKREGESTRRQWWQEVEANRTEYNSLPYERNKFLESTMALARLKLVATFLANNEALPPNQGFRAEEVDFLEDFEEYIIYDRLSVDDIKDYIRSGKDDEKGIVKLAKTAALFGYDQMYKIMEQKNIPNDLALAFQRIYQDRIKKMEVAASTMKLSDAFRDFKVAMEAEEKAILKRLLTPQEAQNLERSYIMQVESRLKQAKEFSWKEVQRFSDLEQIYSELKAVKPIPTDGLGRIAKGVVKKGVFDIVKMALTGNPVFLVNIVQSALTDAKKPKEQVMAVMRESLPNGVGVRALAESSKFLGLIKKSAFILETRVLSDYKQLYLQGYDIGVLTSAEMMIQVQKTAAKVREKQLPYVLGLAATTGWEDKAREAVKESKGIPSNISLALIGLKESTLDYNAEDKRLQSVAGVFQM